MEPPANELEDLYGQMGPPLLAYFRQHPVLANAAEDLLQDTFFRAVQCWDRLCVSVSPRAYLFGIARHVCLDALRRHRPEAALPDEVAAPADPAEDNRLEGMRTAIARLPAPQREALLLKLRHELTYAEIAEVLAIPVGTVRSRLHLAVAHLKLQLNPSAAG